MAIQSFRSDAIETFFRTGKLPKRAGWSNGADVAARKLDMVNAAAALQDLRVPPSNRLKALKGSWVGYYSIRINDQWRVVFGWEGAPHDVDIVDYH